MTEITATKVINQPVAAPGAKVLSDLRFPALIPAEDWATLPRPIRRRFSKGLAPSDSALYGGRVTQTRLTRAGWLLAQAARLIGAPLPLASGAGGAAVVAVSEDPTVGGQFWTRVYHRPGRFPQVIHSIKRFAGPTGLEEYVGRGVGMALTLHVEAGALLFRSAGYFLQLGPWRLPIPRFLTPGRLEVAHREEAGGRFSFSLSLTHPWFGRMIHQVALFSEAQP